MASTDNVKIDALEHAEMEDIVAAQAMISRAFGDWLYFSGGVRSDEGDSSDTAQNYYSTVSGLVPTPNGTGVQLSAGVMVQKDTSNLVPATGSLDSLARVCFLRTATTYSAPSPVGDTWYLLEAQMAEVIDTESRPVLNEGTGNFVSTTVDKNTTFEITTRYRIATGGAQYAAAANADWVPIALVFRPAGGGTVLQAHIRDARKVMFDYRHRATNSEWSSGIARYIECNDSEEVVIEGHAIMPVTGDRVEICTATNVRVGLGKLYSGGVAGLSADTWYYIYACSWAYPQKYTLQDSSTGSAGFVRGGVVALDENPPNDYLEFDKNNVAAPAPYHENALRGRVIGLVLRNAANDGWRPMMCVNGRHVLGADGVTSEFGQNGGIRVASATLSATITSTTTPNSNLPEARLYHFRLVFNGTTAVSSGSEGVMGVKKDSGAEDTDSLAMGSFATGSTTVKVIVDVTVPHQGGANAGIQFFFSAGANHSGTFRAYLTGFEI